MRRMVTGDQTPADAESAAEQVGGEVVSCTCKWMLMDTGNSFYSQIIERDPDCPAHQTTP